MDVENNVRELVKESAASLVKLVRKNSFYIVDDYLNLEQDKIIKYNPAQGELEFQIWLPMEMPAIQVCVHDKYHVFLYLKMPSFNTMFV